jgi:DNA-binding NtrC family response regulator
MQRHLLIIGGCDLPVETWIRESRDTVGLLSCEHVAIENCCIERIVASVVDLVLLLASGPAQPVTNLLRAILARPGTAPLLAVLPETLEGDLVKVAAHTADDLVFAPIRPRELSCRLARLLRSGEADDGVLHRSEAAAAHLKEKLAHDLTLAGLIGSHPAFRRSLARVPLLARSPGPVLLVGETGTGKELFARAIHNVGPRSEFPFIPADCATLPDHLFENEVFGHAPGAFTDARHDQKGLVALAEGGTLFLDEINSLSLIAQSKLLRFLQERIYRPLGASQFLRADVSIVAATNCDLEGMVRSRQFRSDLFYRLNVLRLDLAPLRERRGDIELLSRHFAHAVCAEHGVERKVLAASTLRLLNARDWPGNVRQLYNTIQRAVLLSTGPQILPCDVGDGPEPAPADGPPGTFRQARTRAIELFERRYVEDLMRECGGNVSRAARLAGKDRRAFGRLVKRYGVGREFP